MALIHAAPNHDTRNPRPVQQANQRTHPFTRLLGDLVTIYATDHRRYIGEVGEVGEVVGVDGVHGLVELKRFIEPMTVWLTISTISAVEPAQSEDLEVWSLIDSSSEGER